MRRFVVIEQGSQKMRDSLLVIVSPKTKGMAKKWMPKVCGEDVKVKDKSEFLKTFIPHDIPAKI